MTTVVYSKDTNQFSAFSSFLFSGVMLYVSSWNYPGGYALTQLHAIHPRQQLPNSTAHDLGPVHVHMDVASCMTGISRFLETNPDWRSVITLLA
jgi:alpha-1,6-mannosyltransferase